MITTLYTIEELKEMFVETLFNKTDKVTKVSETSVLNGVAYGVAKIGQKMLKDIALIEAHMFPDSANGKYLDKVAELRGVSQRRESVGSSVYLKLFGDVGTFYDKEVVTFTSISGVSFKLDEDVVIPQHGYIYVKVRSVTKGSNTNVKALTINNVSPKPAGHRYCVNEFVAVGGSDYEDDNLYRERIKETVNIHARNTISYLEQLCFKVNPNILRCFHFGYDSNNVLIIAVATVNGTNLTSTELNDLLISIEPYLSLTEMKNFKSGEISYIKFVNADWFPIDISCRVDLDSSYDIDDVRHRIQTNISSYLDFRFWDWSKKVEWDDLLQIIKNTEGVRYVADNLFYPNVDIDVPLFSLPRLRGFKLLNLDGELITDLQGILNPVYFPNNIDFKYQANYLNK